jgi:hypothetical protein
LKLKREIEAKMNEKKEVSERREKRERSCEKNEIEVVEGKKKKQVSFYAKKSDVKSVMYTTQPIFVLLCKKTYFNTNNLEKSLPIIAIYLLQKYKNIFPDDIHSE